MYMHVCTYVENRWVSVLCGVGVCLCAYVCMHLCSSASPAPMLKVTEIRCQTVITDYD